MTQTRTLTFDSVNPSVNITSPQNNTNTTISISLINKKLENSLFVRPGLWAISFRVKFSIPKSRKIWKIKTKLKSGK